MLKQTPIADCKQAEPIFAHASLGEKLDDVSQQLRHSVAKYVERYFVRQVHETSSVHFLTFILIGCAMDVTPLKGWRSRLINEIERATRPKGSRDPNDTRPSMRQASAEAGLGPNYISQLVSGTETDSRIEKLIAICEILDIDVLHVLTGVRWDPEIQEALAAFSALRQHDPEAWANFRRLLGSFQQRVLDEVDSNMENASQRVRKTGRVP